MEGLINWALGNEFLVQIRFLSWKLKIQSINKLLSALSDREVVSYLGVGMIVNGLFVAPILTYIMPAYYGRYRFSQLKNHASSRVLAGKPGFLFRRSSPGSSKNARPSFFPSTTSWRLQILLFRIRFFWEWWVFIIFSDRSSMLSNNGVKTTSPFLSLSLPSFSACTMVLCRYFRVSAVFCFKNAL